MPVGYDESVKMYYWSGKHPNKDFIVKKYTKSKEEAEFIESIGGTCC